MSVFILKNNDTAEISGSEIHIIISGKAFCLKIDEILKIAILTTDQGPFSDDAALAVTAEESVFLIPSENSLFGKFLFDGIAEKITIDFQKAIEASSCTENAEFVLYRK